MNHACRSVFNRLLLAHRNDATGMRGAANKVAVLALAALLAACGSSGGRHTPEVMEISILGFNDFHGNLEPPRLAVPVPESTGASQVPAGGAAYFASAVASLKAQHPHHLLVSAGDMVGASPPISALFLDEPTIHAFNLMGVDFHAPGNHEFDQGWSEYSPPLLPCCHQPLRSTALAAQLMVKYSPVHPPQTFATQARPAA